MQLRRNSGTMKNDAKSDLVAHNVLWQHIMCHCRQKIGDNHVTLFQKNVISFPTMYVFQQSGTNITVLNDVSLRTVVFVPDCSVPVLGLPE